MSADQEQSPGHDRTSSIARRIVISTLITLVVLAAGYAAYAAFMVMAWSAGDT